MNQHKIKVICDAILKDESLRDQVFRTIREANKTQETGGLKVKQNSIGKEHTRLDSATRNDQRGKDLLEDSQKDLAGRQSKPSFRIGSARMSTQEQNSNVNRTSKQLEPSQRTEEKEPQRSSNKTYVHKRDSFSNLPVSPASESKPTHKYEVEESIDEFDIDKALELSTPGDSQDSRVGTAHQRQHAEPQNEIGRKQQAVKPSSTSKNEPSLKTSPVRNEASEDLFDAPGQFGSNIMVSQNVIMLRIRSSLTPNSKEVGLTAIAVYDQDGNLEKLSPSCLSAQGVSTAMLNNLINGDPQSKKDEQMFRAEFPLLSDYVEIRIKYDGIDPGCLRIWNYNGSKPVGCNKIEVIVNSTDTYLAKLQPAPTKTGVAFSQDILFSKNFQAKAPPQETSTNTSSKKTDPSQTKQDIDYESLFRSEVAMQTEKPTREEPNSRTMGGTRRTQIQDQMRAAEDKFGAVKRDRGLKDYDRLGLVEEENSEKSRNSGGEPSRRVGDATQLGKQEASSRRNLKPKISDPIGDSFVLPGANNEREMHQNESSSNRKPLLGPSKPKVFGMDSQVIDFDLDESQFVPVPATKQSKWNQRDPSSNAWKKKEANKDQALPVSDILDNLGQLDQVRKFDRINKSKIELSGLDISDLPVQKKPIPQTSLTHKPIKSQPRLPENNILPPFPSFKQLVQENEYFMIPEFPRGQQLQLDIYSTWGDKFCVGLCGIEIFDSAGRIVKLLPSRLRAVPQDLNDLPDTSNDPRTLDKVVDGVYNTQDDTHMWLAPFTAGKVNSLSISFQERCQIAAIRIWNYNRDRVHADRGVKEFSIKIDGMLMFFGILQRASGEVANPELNFEFLVFCGEEHYDRISEFDWLGKYMAGQKNIISPEPIKTRPPTGSGSKQGKAEDVDAELLRIRQALEENKKKIESLDSQNKSKEKETSFIECKKLSFKFTENWGDPEYIGLTGIEFIDHKGSKIPVDSSQISAQPKDLQSDFSTADSRVLENILNGYNQTTDSSDMWLSTFSSGSPNYLYVNFGDKTKLGGIRLWNFNAGENEICRGVKKMEIIADLSQISQPFVFVKQAPGHSLVDFGQFIPFPLPKAKAGGVPHSVETNIPNQVCLPPRFPAGFMLTLNLLSTWGDSNYIGLNGLEIYDKKGRPLLSTREAQFQIAADPADVSILPGMSMDRRLSQNLIDGRNTQRDGSSCWLTPYINPHISSASNLYRQKNQLIVNFSYPVQISCIKIWNYGKTLERGVKELEVFFDHSLIFAGELRPGPVETSLIFSSSGILLDKIKAVGYIPKDGQPVAFCNEGVTSAQDKRQRLQWENVERPQTSC